jgi:hypothetical protein
VLETSSKTSYQEPYIQEKSLESQGLGKIRDVCTCNAKRNNCSRKSIKKDISLNLDETSTKLPRIECVEEKNNVFLIRVCFWIPKLYKWGDLIQNGCKITSPIFLRKDNCFAMFQVNGLLTITLKIKGPRSHLGPQEDRMIHIPRSLFKSGMP